MGTRSVTESALEIHSSLQGRILASPFQRFFGLLIDLVLLLVPSSVIAVASAALVLSFAHPEELKAIIALFTTPAEERIQKPELLSPLAPLLVRIQAPGVPPSVALAVGRGDLQSAGKILSRYSYTFSLTFVDVNKPLPPQTIRVEIRSLIPRFWRGIALFGLAAVYFTLLSSGRRRSTLGKWLVGTEVLKLDGEDLTVWESFERFGGYFAALGTLGIGLIDLWRDPNRRLGHDRLSNTVVVRRVPRQPPEDPQSQESQSEPVEP